MEEMQPKVLLTYRISSAVDQVCQVDMSMNVRGSLMREMASYQVVGWVGR